MKQVLVAMSEEQARTVCAALDLFSRLGTGQIEALGQIVRDGYIPMRGEDKAVRQPASDEACARVDGAIAEMKSALGYLLNGSNSIGHSHNAIGCSRAFEVLRAIQGAMQVGRDSGIRYTDDPLPIVTVAEAI